MPPPPIVVHVIAMSISYPGASRNKDIVSVNSRPASIDAAVARVMAIHKHAALPILTAPAIIKVSIMAAAIVK
jgi:hypothetical protein